MEIIEYLLELLCLFYLFVFDQQFSHFWEVSRNFTYDQNEKNDVHKRNQGKNFELAMFLNRMYYNTNPLNNKAATNNMQVILIVVAQKSCGYA